MVEAKTDWMKMKPSDIETLVVDLAKQGNNPSKIGFILRDQHGIPRAKVLGKKISTILAEKKVTYKTEKELYQAGIARTEKHSVAHKHDYTAKKALAKKLWHVKKLA
jgi:small subunit ribosomal protein S15